MIKSIIIVFILINSSLFGQNLNNTEWIKINAERKDGSRIIDRLGTEERATKYYFKESTVLTSISEQYSLEQKYSITNNVLSIGDFITFKIDSISDIFLVITEMSNKGLPDDKINSFVFIKSDYLFDYLKQTQQLHIIGDSLIECDKLFSPVYKEDIANIFKSQLGYTKMNEQVSGYFIMTADGNIKNVQIETTNKLPKTEIEKTTNAIYSTSGSWILPPTPKPFLFKIDFTLNFNYTETFFAITFNFHKKEQIKYKVLTQQEVKEADNYFNDGRKFIKNSKFEKAVTEFEKCTSIDSLYLDAWYNLAFCYEEVGNKTLQCETLKKLKEMGQKEAEKLFFKTCQINETSISTVVSQADMVGHKIFTKSEIPVTYSGGDRKLNKLIKENLNTRLPLDQGAKSDTYKIIIRFIVRIDGTSYDFKPETKFGFGMEEEAIRLLKNIPTWNPAIQNGHKVNAYYRQMVIFDL